MNKTSSDNATWVWYPGDYEIWLHVQVALRREYRGAVMPPFWRLDTFHPGVKFRREVEIASEEAVRVQMQGRGNIAVDGREIDAPDGTFTLAPGKHELTIQVASETVIPSIRVVGATFGSDESWTAAVDSHHFAPVGCRTSLLPDTEPPCRFAFALEPRDPVSVQRVENVVTADFGTETFGYLMLHSVEGDGALTVYYGESPEEAASDAYCEVTDRIVLDGSPEITLPKSRAFRYVRIRPDGDTTVGGVSMLYEYLPLERAGSFRSSDERLNRIWDTAAYTLHLNTREFFLDGIKRDRWVWSGDAVQSFLVNYYLFCDPNVVERTLYALRGQDPVEAHINQIMDYSFYWFIGLQDHIRFTGRTDFARAIYPKAVSLMEFCLGRRNERGMAEGLPDDWIFVDWAPIDNTGEVAVEQMLLLRALEVMEELSGLMEDMPRAYRYRMLAEELRARIPVEFWDEQRGAFTHGRINGELSSHVTKYANIFAVLFDSVDEEKRASIVKNVLLNPEVQAITTPYMRFYELAALCKVGQQTTVLKEILDYWGGMLDRGATSIWEQYLPAENDEEQLAMYGRPFGKSLCHAWGAGPIYLLGRYFLGVEPDPTAPGQFVARPNLGSLEWMEGFVPFAAGLNQKGVGIRVEAGLITVTARGISGRVVVASRTVPIVSRGMAERIEEGQYEVVISDDETVEIRTS